MFILLCIGISCELIELALHKNTLHENIMIFFFFLTFPHELLKLLSKLADNSSQGLPAAGFPPFTSGEISHQPPPHSFLSSNIPTYFFSLSEQISPTSLLPKLQLIVWVIFHSLPPFPITRNYIVPTLPYTGFPLLQFFPQKFLYPSLPLPKVHKYLCYVIKVLERGLLLQEGNSVEARSLYSEWQSMLECYKLHTK